ncbi:MAG: biotin-dependent carboxyltransferase family protein [Chloroflexi bacterium]|nr:biotin-dependent carboxyltransferase family protein [Chloroflexota bacterium]
MSLEILEANGLATIQDAGRFGWRKFGVPVSGPMDWFAFRAANLLAGNHPTAAALEIGLGSMTLRALHNCVIAVAGAGFALSIYIWEFPLWSSYYVRGGWTIHLDKLDSGMWAYLAVSGGVQTPPTLGSVSTYLRGPLGGFDGRSLRAGDVLQAGIPSRPLTDLAAQSLPLEAQPAYSDSSTLDVIMGPQEKYFADESIAKFISHEYTLSATSDRMGYRLEGAALTPLGKTELLSEGMTMGAIQVPSSGQPLVMMADCPTTGGYPKIGTVASADLPLLAQGMPGRSKIRFRKTTVAKAQRKYREMMGRLERIVEE